MEYIRVKNNPVLPTVGSIFHCVPEREPHRIVLKRAIIYETGFSNNVHCNTVEMTRISVSRRVKSLGTPKISVPEPFNKCGCALCCWCKGEAVLSVPFVQNCFPSLSRYDELYQAYGCKERSKHRVAN